MTTDQSQADSNLVFMRILVFSM